MIELTMPTIVVDDKAVIAFVVNGEVEEVVEVDADVS